MTNWDEENRLVGIHTANTANSDQTNAAYQYDALGRRIGSAVNLAETEFTYDGQDVVRDSGFSYQNGPGIDNKLKSSDGNYYSYFLQDHLGSTIGLLDNEAYLSDTTDYDSFGNATNSTFPTRYRFTGREFESATGLQYSRARWYDPQIGRFISEDPIGFAGGDINLYGYVKNQPLIYRDSRGLYPGADVLNPSVLAPLGGLAGSAGALLGAAAASPAVVAGAGFLGGYAIGYYPGQWSANHPSNPFVNGPANPFRIWDKFWEPTPYPAAPAIPVTVSGPACEIRPRPLPWASWPPKEYPIPLGPYPPRGPEKNNECFNRCQHLLDIRDNGVKFSACYRRCMGTIS